MNSDNQALDELLLAFIQVFSQRLGQAEYGHFHMIFLETILEMDAAVGAG